MDGCWAVQMAKNLVAQKDAHSAERTDEPRAEPKEALTAVHLDDLRADWSARLTARYLGARKDEH